MKPNFETGEGIKDLSVYVCPECGEWSQLTTGGRCQWCPEDHPLAVGPVRCVLAQTIEGGMKGEEAK